LDGGSALATQPQTGLTYEDLGAFPQDNLRRELIDGELIVTAAPGRRHQKVVLELGSRLLAYSKVRGGAVYVAPRDVFLANDTILEPDVVFVTADNLTRDEERFIKGPPDIVVEVSSPSTRRLELVRKLETYQRFGVPEYWYVDIETDRVEVYRLAGDRYGAPVILGGESVLDSPLAPGFNVTVAELLSTAPEVD
jgi:Uma2 family endonuclease